MITLTALQPMTVKVAKQHTAGGFTGNSKISWPVYNGFAPDCGMGGRLNLIAGSVCHGCYARKGRNIFPSVVKSQIAHAAAVSDPLWVTSIVTLCKRIKPDASGNRYFRWHSAGDVQGLWHLEKIAAIALHCPEVNFWLPTKEYGIVSQYLEAHGEFPVNLFVKVSAPMVNIDRVRRFPTAHISYTHVYTAGRELTSHKVCHAIIDHKPCGDCTACYSDTNVQYRKH